MCFEGCANLCQRLQRDDPSLTVLNLNNKCMGNDGAIALSRALASNTNLVVLFLENNLLGPSAMRALAQSLKHHPRLAHLYLSHNNNLGDTGCIHLAALLAESPALQVVKADDCAIGPAGGRRIAQVLQTEWTHSIAKLQYLSLQNNKLGDDGILAFCQALDANTTLRCLDVRGNKARSHAIMMGAWIELLRSHNKTLRALHLWETSESPMVMSAMASSKAIVAHTSTAQLGKELSFWLQWNKSGRRSLECTTDVVPVQYVLAHGASSSADVVMATLRTRPDLVDRHSLQAT